MHQIRVCEEKTTTEGVEYFLIKGKYLKFDGKLIGKVAVEEIVIRLVGVLHSP